MRLRTDWLVTEEETKEKQRYHLEALLKGHPITWSDVKFCFRVVYSALYRLVKL